MRTAGRIRMAVIPDFAGATMRDFVTWNITADTTIYTDGLKSFEGLTGAGYEHVEAPRATSRFGMAVTASYWGSLKQPDK